MNRTVRSKDGETMKTNGSEEKLDETFSVKDEAEFREKADYIAEQLPEKLKKMDRHLKIVGDVLALLRFMTDPEVHWGKKALAVGALLYFIIPLDTIPDFAPVVGYLDDLGVIALVITYLGKQLEPYFFEDV